MIASAGLSYCAAQLRRYDPDRFLTALFAPQDRRESLFAIYAFNLEVAKTREVVSEATLGQIRLQWWRDSIAHIYAGCPPRHGVVQPLAEAVARYGLRREHFDRLIDAREADLDDDPPADMAALKGYAEASSGPLVWLALEVLEADDDPACEAGREIGIAWALTGLLRALPFHIRQRRLTLPHDLTHRHDVSIRDVMELRASPALGAVVAEIAAAAEMHLAAARRLRSRVRKEALPALLPATLASGYLRRLRRAGHDPFDVQLARPLASRSFRLVLASLTGRY